MSGIAGIVRLDDTRVDEGDVRSLTHELSFRGPDREGIWAAGCAGFGHTLLRTIDDVDPEPQPATLDGTVWITADARLDGRAELIHLLESSGRRDLHAADDARLILHAYHAWGENCVDRLLGDFAFAIWDGRTRRLFCARDHFGVKPFYYALTSCGIVFSNTLTPLRSQAGVRSALNELAVADFLLFGFNQDATTTTFADVKRLAPAHTLTVDERGARTRKYWSVPLDGRVRYRRSSEYVEQFNDLLHTAVADRLRSSRVGVWMSGGLDSTSITAVARRVLSTSGTSFELRAHTIAYDTLIPDEERRYSTLAAEALGVENTVFTADTHRPFEAWTDASRLMPEPSGDPFVEMRARQLADVAANGRILLCGEGGDEVLWPSRALDIASHTGFRTLAADLGRSIFIHRRRPALGLRRAVKRRWGTLPPAPPFPGWIDATLTARLGLRERWNHFHRADGPSAHPFRPEAHRRLSTAPWSWYFEASDPGVTRVPVEVRYPFLDVRLVKYLLSIPPMPWCVDKEILRSAMRGILPERVRRRRKSPLGGDPLAAGLRRVTGFRIRSEAMAELASYVNTAVAPIQIDGYIGTDPWLDVRPLCLSYWLDHARAHTP